MRLVAVIGVVVLVALPEMANAASVEQVFQEFGLFGTWATDCSSPATPGNPHVNITAPSAGLVLEDHDLGPDFAVNRYSVLSAEPVSQTNVSVQVIFQPGTDGRGTAEAGIFGQQQHAPHHFQSERRGRSTSQGWYRRGARQQDAAAAEMRRWQGEPLT